MSYGKRGVIRKWQSEEVFGCEWFYRKSKTIFIKLFCFKFDIFRQVLKSKMAFGKHIKRLRESKGLFLREVGAALELDSAFISKVENEEKTIVKKTY